MIITIPHFTSHWEDEFDILLFAWFYRVAEKHGWDNLYFMYPDDCRTIAQKYLIAPNIRYGEKFNTWKWIYYSHLTQFTARFQWRKVPKPVKYELKSERAKIIWSYLLGREGEKDLVYESVHKFNKAVPYVLNNIERQKFKYYKSEQTEID